MPHLKSTISTFFNTRTLLLKWTTWFAGGNILLFWLIGFRYILEITPLTFPSNVFTLKLLTWAFLLFAFIGQMALLALMPIVLLVIPLILLCSRNQNFIFITAILISTLAATLLIIDVIVFKQLHFHLNGFVFELISNKAADQIFDFSWQEYLLVGCAGGFFLLLESSYAVFIWKKLNSYPLNWPTWLISSSVGCLLLSYYMFILGLLHPTQGVNKRAIALPLYESFISQLLPLKNNLPYLSTLGNSNFTQLKQPNEKLHYPLHTLTYRPNKPFNLVIIVIDAWRFDMINSVVTPNLAKFAQQSWQFTQHNSGGNGTQPGIFSLFYGLPANYWTSTIEQKKEPVLIGELLHRHYQTGIFAGAALSMPAFNLNVFNAIKDLQVITPGKDVYERDRNITKEFQQFITKNHQNKQPFFGFLFYDAAHSYCINGNPINLFKPIAHTCNRLLVNNLTNPAPYLNRYKNSLYFIDSLIGEVFAELNKYHLLDNTVVLITGDHGNEFNDHNSGYWEHPSNFTRYQIQTPLLIHWPGKPAAVFAHPTSHYDIIPTLMANLLGCKNPASDYSIGNSLLTQHKPPYLLVHSYINFGIIERGRITTILPSGNYQIDNPNGQPLANATLHLDVLKQILSDMRRYYSS